MTIRLEIIGENADDFLAHMRRVAEALTGVSAAVPGKAHDPVMPEVKEHRTPEAPDENVTPADKPARTRKPKSPDKEPEPAAEAPEPEQAVEPAAEAPAAEDAAEDAKSLDFDTDVAPAVTQAVAVHGRDAVVAVLDQFGVTRASELTDPTRWQELLDRLADLG